MQSMAEEGKAACFEERNEEGIEAVSYVYNPHKSMSIQSQRTRLPIFESRDQILYLLHEYQTVIIQGGHWKW